MSEIDFALCTQCGYRVGQIETRDADKALSPPPAMPVLPQVGATTFAWMEYADEVLAENERLADDNRRLTECWEAAREAHDNTQANNERLTSERHVTLLALDKTVAENERLKADVAWRDFHLDAAEAEIEQLRAALRELLKAGQHDGPCERDGDDWDSCELHLAISREREQAAREALGEKP